MLLSQLLDTTDDRLYQLNESLSIFTGKTGVLEKLESRLKEEAQKAFSELGMESPSYHLILSALEEKVAQTEEALLSILGNPDCSIQKGCTLAFSKARQISNVPPGHFLREDAAQELLFRHPPQKILATLGYQNVAELLEKEDLWEIYAALRFVEEREWLNTEFFKAYEGLRPSDFEEREIKLLVLSPQWQKIGEEFMKKKFHNVSHLKELGFIFVLPVKQVSGVFTRMFSLLLHYHHEISFYGRFFKYVSENEPEAFSRRLVSALRGDVRESLPTFEGLVPFMIIQRYLFKENPSDPRLKIPHLAPEAWHWKKAMDDFRTLGEHDPSLGLGFWSGKSYLGALLDTRAISFNFEDNAFSLPAAGEILPAEDEQFTYHFKEALWNEIFFEYFGEEGFEDLLVENFSQGFVAFKMGERESE